MKTPKFTKFLPVALTLMLMSPAAFADDPASQSSELTLTVPYFISITKENESITGQAEFNADYTQITSIKPQLVAGYKVITNTNTAKEIKVTAKTGTNGGANTNALYQDNDQLYIVFANTVNVPDEGAVTNITDKTSTAVGANPNAIAFALTEAANADTTEASAATTDPKYSFADGELTYSLTNGIYHFLYTVGTTSVANTFSTHDTNGTYKTTITITDSST